MNRVSIIDNRKSLRVSARRISVSVSAQRRPMRLSINGGTPRNLEVSTVVHPLRVSGPRLPLTLARTQRIVLVSRGTVSPPPAFGTFVAGEPITSSSLTHVSPIDGKIYLADCALDRPACSFTIAGCSQGESLIVSRGGPLFGLAGIVPGQAYYLGTAGQVRTTMPTDGITQRVGDGISTTSIFVAISEEIFWE